MEPTEIIPNLYLGNINNSATFDGASICVLETRDTYAQNATWLPIMKNIPSSVEGVTTYVADKKNIDAVAEAIDVLLAAGKKVLVHCYVGMERSPFAVMQYLKTKKGMTEDEAYDLIISKRPIVQRRVWPVV